MLSEQCVFSRSFLTRQVWERAGWCIQQGPQAPVSREAGFSVDPMLWLVAGWEVSTVCFFFPSLVLQSSSLDESSLGSGRYR